MPKENLEKLVVFDPDTMTKINQFRAKINDTGEEIIIANCSNCVYQIKRSSRRRYIYFCNKEENYRKTHRGKEYKEISLNSPTCEHFEAGRNHNWASD